ncbi:hypothetical protein DPV78_002515 [Talaromyces pinophilus]|nr:hypothetical protein DPV78_002515 [Talaromyces pinophilus]
MDADYEYPIYGWTATNHYNETLDLFYHRWQTGQEAQEIFLEQNTLVLEAEGGQPQQIQVNTGIVTRDDAQVAASWNSLWDEEEDSDNTEQEDSFYYCLSPEKVCSLESITSTGGTVVSFSFIGEERGREFPSTGGHINEAQGSTMPSPPPSHASPDPSDPSRVTNTENLDNADLSGPERSGLPPHDLDRLASERCLDQDGPRTDKPTHGTRWEPITVMLGNWEKEYTVIKPYADYTDVPSPIILPGSPPQRAPKPSLSGFYKVPTVRDPLEEYLKSGSNRDVEEASPPAPPLQFPEIATSKNPNQNQNLRRGLQRSNSDISFLDLGDPYQPLDTKHLAGDSNTAISLSLSRGAGASASGHPTSTSICQPLVSPPLVTLRPVQGLRARRGLEGTTLSVQIPANSDPRRSASGSPRFTEASTTSSLGATFQLDEELNNCEFFPRRGQR